MRKETAIFAAFFISLALILSAGTARAASYSASDAWLDWTSFTITGDITWLDQGSGSYAYVKDDTGWQEDLDEMQGWVDTAAAKSLTYANAEAWTNDNELYEAVDALTIGPFNAGAYSDAWAYRWGDFVANSDGIVTISADYELSQELTTDFTGEWAWGWSEAGLFLVNENTFSFDEVMPGLFNMVFDGDSFLDSDSGTMEVSLFFSAGDTGYMEAWVYNEAQAIPEPATLVMLSLGALGFLRHGRQR